MSNSNIINEASKLNPNAEEIKKLLERDPNLIFARSPARDDRETLLHKCVMGGNNYSLECVKVLLAHEPKIDINGLTDDGMTDEGLTPLDYAFQSEGPAKEEIIKLLEDNGATHSRGFKIKKDRKGRKGRKGRKSRKPSKGSKARKSKSRKGKSRKNY
jgi:hypothetical protein